MEDKQRVILSKKLIDWHCDADVLICFNREPCVKVRVITPDMTTLQKKSIAKYPFSCVKPLDVLIYDIKKNKQYMFCIKEHYCWDGASIPRFAWRIIGANTAAEFLIPSLIHDVLCENHKYIDNNRELSSKVFRGLLLESGVGKIKAQLMYLAVDNFQRFCKWENDV